jgi:mono/diheme cytochrome c family protein
MQNNKSTLRHLPYLLLALGFAFFIINCSDNAQKSDAAADGTSVAEAALTPVEEGKEWFISYCAVCHGDNADGHGIMADSLVAAPPDLNNIAKRRDGVFPDDEVAKIIAGVENVPGHTVGEMPAWWETFQKSEGITDEKVLKEKIGHIVAYLKTIQKN